MSLFSPTPPPEVIYEQLLKGVQKISEHEGSVISVRNWLLDYLTSHKEPVMDWLKAQQYNWIIEENIDRDIEHENEFGEHG